MNVPLSERNPGWKPESDRRSSQASALLARLASDCVAGLVIYRVGVVPGPTRNRNRAERLARRVRPTGSRWRRFLANRLGAPERNRAAAPHRIEWTLQATGNRRRARLAHNG